MTVPVDTLAKLFASSRAETQLFDVLRRELPCTIELLFGAATVHSVRPPQQRRQMQQSLGGIIARMNRKLGRHGWKIKPADPRGTYQLQPIAPPA